MAWGYKEEYGLDVCVLRFFGSYGERQYLNWWGGPQGAIPRGDQRGQADHGPRRRQPDPLLHPHRRHDRGDRARGREPRGERRDHQHRQRRRDLDPRASRADARASRASAGEPNIELIPYEKVAAGAYQDVQRRMPDLTQAARDPRSSRPESTSKTGISRLWEWYREPGPVSGAYSLLYNRPVFFKDAATITDHIDAVRRATRTSRSRRSTRNGGFPRAPRDLRFRRGGPALLPVRRAAPGRYLIDARLPGLAAATPTPTRSPSSRTSTSTASAGSSSSTTTASTASTRCFDASRVRRDLRQPHERLADGQLHAGLRQPRHGRRGEPPPPPRRASGRSTSATGHGRRRPTSAGAASRRSRSASASPSAAAGSGLALDISAREEDRLYGEQWYEFLADSRGQLGTESGASCVDLEDEVRAKSTCAGARAAGRVTLEDLEQGALGQVGRGGAAPHAPARATSRPPRCGSARSCTKAATTECSRRTATTSR